MTNQPQENYDVRHQLAVERTIYANERTFLAFVRTALTLVITGISFLGFGNSLFLKITAWVFIPSGIIILIVGYSSFIKRSAKIKKEKDLINLSLNK